MTSETPEMELIYRTVDKNGNEYRITCGPPTKNQLYSICMAVDPFTPESVMTTLLDSPKSNKIMALDLKIGGKEKWVNINVILLNTPLTPQSPGFESYPSGAYSTALQFLKEEVKDFVEDNKLPNERNTVVLFSKTKGETL